MTVHTANISVPDPPGEPARPALSYRFVLLQHDWPEPHLDLMIQDGRPDLRTWALDSEPGLDPTIAHELPRHRPDYLDYEGPVSGGRGTVRRLDAGACDPVQIDSDRVVLRLHGAAFRGQLRLDRVDAQTSRGPVWLATLQNERDASSAASRGASPR